MGGFSWVSFCGWVFVVERNNAGNHQCTQKNTRERQCGGVGMLEDGDVG
jgi:hypothetical protein